MWVYHHGMVHPWVADGGDEFQIQRVTTNILNKQSKTANKGWSSSLGIGWGGKQFLTIKKACYEILYKAMDFTKYSHI
jgi:hypothetical protein